MKFFQLGVLATIAFLCSACASTNGTDEPATQAADEGERRNQRAQSLPAIEEFSSLDNPRLISQVRGAIFAGDGGQAKLLRARAALDELASRGSGELFERVWSSMDAASFSAVQKNDGSGRRNDPIGRVLGPKPLVEYRVLAYSKLESLAASGYGHACALFQRAYGRTPAGLEQADISDFERQFRQVRRQRFPVLGVAGHPDWDSYTWQSVGASPAKRGMPISAPTRYGHSSHATIPIPDAVIAGCSKASTWTSLSAADERQVGSTTPNELESELDGIRTWANQWRTLKTEYELALPEAPRLWENYEHSYLSALSDAAGQLDATLSQRGGSIQYDLGTALRKVDRWLGTQSRYQLGPMRHVMMANGEYIGRQLAIGNEGFARHAIRRSLAAEEARMLRNGVVLSAQGTPIHFIAVAGEAFGKPLAAHRDI